MYLLGVKTPFPCFLLIRTLSRPLAVSVPGTSIGMDFTLGHFKQLLREPRKIEILGQKEDSTFSVKGRLLSTILV